MFQKLFRICSWVLICTVLFNAQKGVSSEIHPECCVESLEESLPSKSTFRVVSNEDLHLVNEGILVNINGTLHPVNSLKKTGNQWLYPNNLKSWSPGSVKAPAVRRSQTDLYC